MKIAVSFLGLVFSFFAGFYISFNSLEFPAYDFKLAQMNSSIGSGRDPAAIQKVFDFSSLDGSALNFALKQRVIDGAEVIRSQDGVGIQLGHFVVRGTEGHKQFACQKYSRIAFSFEGVGMLVSNSPPKMEIEGDCEISADINTIAPIWIPVAKILAEKVADQEFDFQEEQPVKISFLNVSDQWPTTWNLKAIRLFDKQKPNDEIIIGSEEIRSILSKPFLIEFPK